MRLEAFAGPKARHLEVRVEGHAVGSIELGEGWRELQLPVAPILGVDRLSVRLDSDSWVPDEVHGNGDLRRLGIAFRRLELVAPEGSGGRP